MRQRVNMEDDDTDILRGYVNVENLQGSSSEFGEMKNKTRRRYDVDT